MSGFEDDFDRVLEAEYDGDIDVDYEFGVPIIQPIKKNTVDYYDLLKRHKKKRKLIMKVARKELVMPVGKYAGVAIDKLPLSYCRWIVSQKFDAEILKIAKKKIANSIYSEQSINISRHAIDTFSIRFIDLWINRPNKAKIGLGTFIADLAQQAWDKGENVSKNRYEGDGIIKQYKDMKFVFHGNDTFKEYKELVTVM